MAGGGGGLTLPLSPAPGPSAPRSPSEPVPGDAESDGYADVPAPGLSLSVRLAHRRPGRRLPCRPGVGEHVTRGTAPQPAGRPRLHPEKPRLGGRDRRPRPRRTLAALRSRPRRGPRLGSPRLLEGRPGPAALQSPTPVRPHAPQQSDSPGRRKSSPRKPSLAQCAPRTHARRLLGSVVSARSAAGWAEPFPTSVATARRLRAARWEMESRGRAPAFVGVCA